MRRCPDRYGHCRHRTGVGTSRHVTAVTLPHAPPPHGPLSMLACSADGPGPILPRSACLRLILFRTCPPLCAGAQWPMPAWVWRDVRSDFVFFCWHLGSTPQTIRVNSSREGSMVSVPTCRDKGGLLEPSSVRYQPLVTQCRSPPASSRAPNSFGVCSAVMLEQTSVWKRCM